MTTVVLDDSVLPSTEHPAVQTSSLRVSKSLSPASLSSASPKHIIHKRNSHPSFNTFKDILKIDFTNFDEQKLETFLAQHPVFFRISQEFLLLYHPIAFIIFISILNLSLYFYRSFHLSFYAHITILTISYYLYCLIFPLIWPIIYETLFVKDEDIPKLKIQEEPSTSSDQNANHEDKNSDQNKDPRYDKSNPSHLRTPHEAAQIVQTFFEPVHLIIQFFIAIFKDQTLEGELITAGICLFFFFVTYLFDLFWSVAIILNLLLILPGIYYNEKIREMYNGFRRKWMSSK